MANILEQICEDKRVEVAERKARVPEALLMARIADVNDTPRSFFDALSRQARAHQTALIAEVKKASPSKGVIRKDFNPVEIAKSYEAAGASCLSVLTDLAYFQGHDAYLKLVRDAVKLPILRKDFMLEPYQIIESRSIGADAVLLIMAALSDGDAIALEATAKRLGMDVLVEVHDEKELSRAITHLDSPLIGINNRDLTTMEVNTETTLRLMGNMPSGKLVVCESGIGSRSDVVKIQQSGVYTFLVGESLMREDDVEAATRALLS